jgi:hypothetical protein
MNYYLPLEIWKQIFNYFSFQHLLSNDNDLLNFRLVSRQWRDAIKQIPLALYLSKKFEAFEGITSSLWIGAVSIWSTEVNPSFVQFLKECKYLKKMCVIEYAPDILPYIPYPNALEDFFSLPRINFPISNLVNLKYLR